MAGLAADGHRVSARPDEHYRAVGGGHRLDQDHAAPADAHRGHRFAGQQGLDVGRAQRRVDQLRAGRRRPGLVHRRVLDLQHRKGVAQPALGR